MALVEHLQHRTDMQNINLMNLAGFCRNCLSKWYRGAANEGGIDLSYDEAREVIYGMPYPIFVIATQNISFFQWVIIFQRWVWALHL